MNLSKTVYFKDRLTGGSFDSLDGINGDFLADKDAAFVVDGNNFRVYILDEHSSAEEQVPSIIAPDVNPGTKRWILRGSDVSNKITYATWCVAQENEPYPLSASTHESYFSRFAGDPRFRWSHYTRCPVRLTMADGTTIESEDGFDSTTDLLSWVNSVAPNNGSTFQNTPYLVTLFDRISGDVPQLQKVYGINWLLASLFHPRRYRAGTTCTAYDSQNPSLCRNLVVQVSTHFNNTGSMPCAISASDYDAVGNPQVRNIIWRGATARNLYGLPRLGSRIEFVNSIGTGYVRHWWDCSTKNIVVTSASNYQLIDYAYVVGTLSATVEVYDKSEFWVNVLSHMFSNHGDISFGLVYLVQGPTSSQFAFYFKPLGIDRVHVDYFDDSKYRLEQLSFWKDKQVRLSTITVPGGLTGRDMKHDRMLVPRSQWFAKALGPAQQPRKNVGEQAFPKIYFRLRRLSDGKVGLLSNGYIAPELRYRNAPLKWMVH